MGAAFSAALKRLEGVARGAVGVLKDSQRVVGRGKGKETHSEGSGTAKTIPQSPQFRNCARSS